MNMASTASTVLSQLTSPHIGQVPSHVKLAVQVLSLSRWTDVLGLVPEEGLLAVLEAILAGDVGQGLTALTRLLDEGVDARVVRRQLIAHLRDALVVALGVKIDEESSAPFGGQASSQIDCRGCFAAAALLIGDGYHPHRRLLMALSPLGDRACCVNNTTGGETAVTIQ